MFGVGKVTMSSRGWKIHTLIQLPRHHGSRQTVRRESLATLSASEPLALTHGLAAGPAEGASGAKGSNIFLKRQHLHLFHVHRQPVSWAWPYPAEDLDFVTHGKLEHG